MVYIGVPDQSSGLRNETCLRGLPHHRQLLLRVALRLPGFFTAAVVTAVGRKLCPVSTDPDLEPTELLPQPVVPFSGKDGFHRFHRRGEKNRATEAVTKFL